MTEVKKVELWDVKDLVPYEMNVKKHPPEQIKKLAATIKRFGWGPPIEVWTNGEIIAGHGRRLAAIELRLEKVPVIVRDDLTKSEADAVRLADNRVSSTEYDHEMMGIEINRLMSEDDSLNMDEIFDPKEIDFTMSDLGDIDDDFFVEGDINEAVNAQQKENEDSIERTDDVAAPVTDALGFKRVSIAQSRQISNLLGELSEKTDGDRIKALIGALETAAQ